MRFTRASVSGIIATMSKLCGVVSLTFAFAVLVFGVSCSDDAMDDAAVRDAGTSDAARTDATAADAFTNDAASVDAFTSDAFTADVFTADAIVADTGPGDVGVADAGVILDASQPLTSTVSWQASDGTPSSACAGWTLIDTATPEEPTAAAGVLTVATSAEAENMYYTQDDNELIAPNVLVLEGTLRFVSGGASVASRSGASLGFRLGTGLAKNMLFIQDGEIFILTSENVKGMSLATATTDAPHVYRIEADLVNGPVRVLRDGVLALTGSTFPEPDPNGLPTIFFGEASVFGYGTSEWSSVTHNAHALVPCP